MRKSSLFSFIAIFACLTATSAFAVETVKVGVALSFAPEMVNSNQSIWRGIELAKDKFNSEQFSKNGDLKIELVRYSHERQSKSVDDTAKKIIADKIHYVLGGQLSDEAIGLAEAFHGKDVLLLTPTATNPRVTEGHPYVFRVNFSDDQVAGRLAKWVAKRKDSGVIGLLHNTGSIYSDYLSMEFMKVLKKEKNSVQIKEFNYAGDRPDFSSAVSSFKKANVKLVVAFIISAEFKAFVSAASRADYSPQYLGADGWGPPDDAFKQFAANPNNKGFYGMLTSYWQEESKNAAVTKFVKLYEKQYGSKPDSVGASGYDAATMLFRSIEKAHEKVHGKAQAKAGVSVGEVATILKGSRFQDLTTSRDLKFNASNSPDKSLFIYEVDKNGVRFLGGVE